MCSKRFLFTILFLVTILTSQCEAFTAGAGGYNGKRSKIGMQSDYSVRLDEICSVTRNHCPESKKSMEDESYTARGRFLS
ncbi:hypothetical protein AWC38_SpisGene18771 [Stylophora pistillata]|uniref:Uncharacterized protein n=1 Tax=Stylophora pistillata TaxID=50429 RepID=A0A2B4RKN2_STYPI|nr:hypothetical protein AWC38_SpisGene18771 [Stylophora pistillata]